MTLITFVAQEKEETWERLTKLFDNLDTGMTKDRYLTMCEQMGTKPSTETMPPDIEDLPDLVQYAIKTYNMLGDRVYPEIGYIGKDYTNLPIYIKLYGIEDMEFFLELLSWLDSRAIKKSSAAMKKVYDKLKRK